MPIEFNCPSCDKRLRVADTAAGKQARCPHCGSVAPVPDASPPGGSGEAGGDFPGGSQPPPFAAGPPPRDEPVNPYAAPQEAAGPALGGAADGPIGHGILDVGAVIDRAWQLWQRNLGLLVGAFVVIALVNIAVSVPFQLVQGGLQQQGNFAGAAMIGLFGNIIGSAISIFLQIGYAQIGLRLARGQHAEFSQLFGGGPRFLPVLGVSMLLGLAIGVGLFFCVVPGIILALMWWPAYFLVVEDKAEVIESFTVAGNVTRNNWGNALVLWIASVGIMVVGLLALCIGIIFAAPLVHMMWIIAYLMITGQLREGIEA